MNQLIKYDTARKALELAAKVDEVKTIIDQSQAIKAYAPQAKDQRMIAWATEINLRARRKAGQMLAQMAKEGKRDIGKPTFRRIEYLNYRREALRILK
jgi:hypothetical protein